MVLSQNPDSYSFKYDWSHVSTGSSEPDLSFDTALPIFAATEYNLFLVLLLRTYRLGDPSNFGSAVYQFQVHEPPLTDSLVLKVSPAFGVALSDLFNISCSGNTTKMSSTSLTYSIGYITTDTTSDAIASITTRALESMCSWITFRSKKYRIFINYFQS